MSKRLSPEQQRVLADFQIAAAHQKSSPIERKAAIEGGLVESGLRNLHYGDADSLGALQERTSIYGRKHALNPRASFERFLRDARKLKRKGMTAGQLAQAVQRSAFPGRYDQHGAEAEAILRGLGGSQGGAVGFTGSRGHMEGGSAPHFVAGKARTNTDAAVIDSLLAGRSRHGSLLQDLTTRLDSGEYVAPGQGHWRGGRGPRFVEGKGIGVTGGSKRGGRFDIKELFWQGPHGVDIKDGKRVPLGFVSGHTDHVHVASGPKQIVRIGKLAEQMGLHVGENPHFGGVHPVHAEHSYHYRNEAIDVSGSAAKMAAFARRIAKLRKAVR